MENRLPMGVMKDQSPVDVLRSTRIEIIEKAHDRGLKSEDLGDQPAFWMLEGLREKERGGKIDKEWLKRIDESGGTDHPDPYV